MTSYFHDGGYDVRPPLSAHPGLVFGFGSL